MCRLYLPLDELAEYGMSEEEVSPGLPAVCICASLWSLLHAGSGAMHLELAVSLRWLRAFASSCSAALWHDNRFPACCSHSQPHTCVQVLKGMFCRHTGAIDDRWVRFMKFQIARAKGYFADAQAGVNLLDENARWPVWSALILYRCVC